MVTAWSISSFPNACPAARSSALKIGDQHDLRMLGLMRGTEFLCCDQDGVALQADDRLILLGKRPELRRFGDVL